MIMALVTMGVASGCIEDGFETSPSAQPDFSTDTLRVGMQYADEPSPTYVLKIYNRHSRQLNLQQVGMRRGEAFRINVDGQSGTWFSNVEIRPNDSIYVFVEATLPATGLEGVQQVTDYLDVTTNGVTRSVVLTGQSTDVVRVSRLEITENTVWDSPQPYLIRDTVSVAPGVTLTLAPGTSLRFHDKAAMVVHGTLRSQGSAEQPVSMRGDRMGEVVGQVSFDVMSNQWEGLRFAAGSTGNHLEYTEIANTCQGVAVDSLATLTMVNSRLTNSGSILVTAAPGATFTAIGCELSNAADALLLAGAGTYRLDRCTLANWYLFAYPMLAIVNLTEPEGTTFLATNCVIYGRGTPVAVGQKDQYGLEPDITALPITFGHCMFKATGEDDANYVNTLWDVDPMLEYSLTDYTFSYLPLEESPVLEAADSTLNSELLPAIDFHGRTRGLTLGAYAPEEKE